MGKNGEDAVAEAAPPEVNASTLLPVDQLQDWKHGNGRHDYDKAELEELANSMRGGRGVIQPLIVRRLDGQGKGGKPYEIVAGHRRIRAAVLAGLAEVPCIVKVLSDDEAKLQQAIENLQRVNPHPLDEALGYQDIQKRYKFDAETIAAKVGKQASYVVKRLKLCDLIPEAQKHFRQKAFGIEYAILLARLEPEHQKAALKGNAGPSKGSVAYPAELEEWIADHILLDLKRAPWKLDDEKLCAAAGACLTCPKRTGYNKVLFDDLAKEDLCTDPKCFHEKKAALLKQKEDEVKAQGGEYVRITTAPYPHWQEEQALKKAGVIRTQDYHEPTAKDKPENIKTALVVHGDGTGNIVKVALGPAPGTSSSTGRPQLTEKQKDERKKERDREALEEKIEDAQVRAVVKSVKDKLTAEHLAALLELRWDRAGHDVHKQVCKFLGWDVPKPTGNVSTPDYHGYGEKAIQQFSATQVNQMHVLLCLLGYGQVDGEELLSWSRLGKIDLKKIEAHVRAEQKAAAKPAAQKPKVEDKPKAAKKSSTPAKSKPKPKSKAKPRAKKKTKTAR